MGALVSPYIVHTMSTRTSKVRTSRRGLRSAGAVVEPKARGFRLPLGACGQGRVAAGISQPYTEAALLAGRRDNGATPGKRLEWRRRGDFRYAGGVIVWDSVVEGDPVKSLVCRSWNLSGLRQVTMFKFC